MNITVLNGGIGGAKFLQGVEYFADANESHSAGSSVTAVVNTADDFWLSGLRVCPDLDSVLYALAGVNDVEQGWGRALESYRVQAELTAYGAGWDWFQLGDQDIATHIARTGWLRDGLTLTECTNRLSARWNLRTRILPMTDAEVETHVIVEDGNTAMHLEEWWVKHRAALAATGFRYVGAESARATPEVRATIAEADVVLIAPSNPIVSIRPILEVPGVTESLAETKAKVIGISPIIGGAPVRGMATQCLSAAGVDCSARGVAEYYGARTDGGILDGWLLAEEDAGSVALVRQAGIACAASNLWMRSPEVTAEMVRGALDLV